MRRGGLIGTDALETMNAAAAAAIASPVNRAPRASVQKRRWVTCWSLYWCFGSHKSQRIGHAVLVPETTVMGSDAPAVEHPSLPPSMVPSFTAPPSSPASYLPSEPPSATQSPTSLLSLPSTSALMYSPGGPASIFAIGPYAHETQLVSPPVFSTFTTEPSTAPYTPSPEPFHLTTSSSPEVPFAKFLEPNLQNREAVQRYPHSQDEFLSYHLQPGSPVSHLISPTSGISGSGTSSPFPYLEVVTGFPFTLEFKTGSPPKLLDLQKIELREWKSPQGSGAVTPDAAGLVSCENFLLCHPNSEISPLPCECNELRKDETLVDRRVSFEIIAEEVKRCVEKKPVDLPRAVPEPVQNVEHTGEERSAKMANSYEYPPGESSGETYEKAHTDDENEEQHKENQTITLGPAKEFNFDNIDGGNSVEPRIESDWWVNEKVLGGEGGPQKNWSFFPVMQTDHN